MPRLEDVDQAHSTVRAVVSVNNLKEGWGVHSIAVMVTLRAMASEVLTQQTIGRGLRLPFGRHTGNRTVDTLDVLSHASFKKMLSSEQILKEFGLERAVPPAARPVDFTTPAPGSGGSPASPGPAEAPGAENQPSGTWGELTNRGAAAVVSLARQDAATVDSAAQATDPTGRATVAWNVTTPAVMAVLLDDDADLGEMQVPTPDFVHI